MRSIQLKLDLKYHPLHPLIKACWFTLKLYCLMKLTLIFRVENKEFIFLKLAKLIFRFQNKELQQMKEQFLN